MLNNSRVMLLSAGFIFISLATTAFAAAPTYYPNPIIIPGITSIPQFLLLLVDLVFLVAMPIVVLFIIYGGYQLLTAGDNESKVTKAKFTIMWSLVGVAVLLGAKVIAKAIETTVLSL